MGVREDECYHDLNMGCPPGEHGLEHLVPGWKNCFFFLRGGGLEEPLGGGVQLEEEVSLTQPSHAHALVGILAWDGQTHSGKGLPNHGHGF